MIARKLKRHIESVAILARIRKVNSRRRSLQEVITSAEPVMYAELAAFIESDNLHDNTQHTGKGKGDKHTAAAAVAGPRAKISSPLQATDTCGVCRLFESIMCCTLCKDCVCGDCTCDQCYESYDWPGYCGYCRGCCPNQWQTQKHDTGHAIGQHQIHDQCSGTDSIYVPEDQN